MPSRHVGRRADRFRRIFLRAAMSAVPCLCGAISVAVAAPCSLAMVASVPLIMGPHGHQALVDVALNHVPAQLIVDTGEESLSITDALYRLAATDRPIGSLLPSGDDSQHGFSMGVGGAREIDIGEIEHFTIGQASGAFEAQITDNLNYWGSDGLLGMSFLANFDIDFNMLNNNLRLFKAAGDCTGPAVALAGDTYAMPFLSGYARDLSPRVKIEVNGHDMTALLDSGASHSTIFRRAAEQAGLETNGKSFLISGIGGTSTATVANIDTLVVGPLTFHNEPVEVDSEDIGRADMLLGFDFLNKVHVWVSNSSHQLILQYPPVSSPNVGG